MFDLIAALEESRRRAGIVPKLWTPSEAQLALKPGDRVWVDLRGNADVKGFAASAPWREGETWRIRVRVGEDEVSRPLQGVYPREKADPRLWRFATPESAEVVFEFCYAYSPRENVRSGGGVHAVLSRDSAPLTLGRIHREPGDPLCSRSRRFWGLDGGRDLGRFQSRDGCVSCQRYLSRLTLIGPVEEEG